MNREPDLVKEAIHQGTYKLQVVAYEFFQHGNKVSRSVIRFIFFEMNPPQPFFLRRELISTELVFQNQAPLSFILHAEVP